MEGVITLTELKTVATLDDVGKIAAAFSLKVHLQNEAQKKENGGKS